MHTNVTAVMRCRILRGHSQAIRCLRVKESCILSGGVDRTIRIWSTTNFTATRVLRGMGAANFGMIADIHVRAIDKDLSFAQEISHEAPACFVIVVCFAGN